MGMTLDVLFVNGRIRTGDPRRPMTGSLGVRDGRIATLGAGSHGLPTARVVDLAGAHVVPGFHDAHFHLSALGQSLRNCNLSPTAVRSLDELYARVGAHAARLPSDAWVIGEGFDDLKLGGRPTRRALDAVTGGRPAWLIHASHHAGVMNTAALVRLGYPDAKDFPDVVGGIVGRDADGSPDGYLSEKAAQRIGQLRRPEPFLDFAAAIGAGSDAALAMGLTSVTEPGISGTLTGNGPDDYAAFEHALSNGSLRVRTTLMPEYAAIAAGLRREDCPQHPDRLRLGAVKIFSDGALSARTAALTCDYLHPADAGRGIVFYEPETVRSLVADLHASGWQIATHAIGDRAIDMVLDAYEAALSQLPRSDARHRIEHAGLLRDAQIERMHRLGVVPVPQARFITEFADVYREALGDDRAGQLFRQRSLLDVGLIVPGSSDCPVVNGAPLFGIDALVNRIGPDGKQLGAGECITAAEALRNFTHGSAYAEHAESDKGSLEIGKLADFVVLSDDLLRIAPERIADIKVLATIVGGIVEYGDLG